jgi:hypothetical protein
VEQKALKDFLDLSKNDPQSFKNVMDEFQNELKVKPELFD